MTPKFASLDPSTFVQDTVEGRQYVFEDFCQVDPIAAARDVMQQRHYAGDLNVPLLVYIAFTSRVLPKPMNVIIVAPSSAGKSRSVRAAQELMPEYAYREIQASSQKLILHLEEDMRHRMFIFPEVDSIPDDGVVASAIRNLLDKGRLEYEYVGETFDPETKTKGLGPQKRCLPGPSGLITTSTKSLPIQLGTRCLELTIDGNPERTKAINWATIRARRVSAALEQPVDVSAFHALQEYLQLFAGQWKVQIPYDEALAELLPPISKLHRDLPQVLTAIETVALLRVSARIGALPDPETTIEATLEDYALVRELIEPYLQVDLADGLTEAGFRVVDKIPFPGDQKGPISISELARQLNLSTSTVHGHVERAKKGGWIYDDERPYTGKPARLLRTDRKRASGHVLPTTTDLDRVWRRNVP